MTEVDRAIGPELGAPRLGEAGPGGSCLGEPALDVGQPDVLVALATAAASLAVLIYGMSTIASAPIFMLLHLAVLVGPAAFLRMRMRGGGELTVPVLLLIATFTAGPVGALGCAIMALVLWRQSPSPARLQDWYDYIAGVVARTHLTRIYDELASGRLPSASAAKVPRFGPIMPSSARSCARRCATATASSGRRRRRSRAASMLTRRAGFGERKETGLPDRLPKLLMSNRAGRRQCASKPIRIRGVTWLDRHQASGPSMTSA
jgi:hypothetical protein